MNNPTKIILDIHTNDGIQDTLIPGVYTFRNTNNQKVEPLLYDISMVFITSGSKKIYLNEKTFTYGKGKFLFVALPTPFLCETSLGEDNIFAGLTITITRESIISLAHEINTNKRGNSSEIEVGVLALDQTDKITNALSRLLDCCMIKEDAKILGPMIIKEILYYALQEPGARDFCDSIINNNYSNTLSNLVMEINNNYNRDITVEGLAKDMNMSGPTFYRHFKAFTGYSPIQYLKNLRLNKAKDFINIYGLSVKETSGKVGYNSVSQFSRDYKKYFGHTPLKKIRIKKKTNNL